eukprot:1192896-Prorocentrum_minimum.AAC.4
MRKAYPVLSGLGWSVATVGIERTVPLSEALTLAVTATAACGRWRGHWSTRSSAGAHTGSIAPSTTASPWPSTRSSTLPARTSSTSSCTSTSCRYLCIRDLGTPGRWQTPGGVDLVKIIDTSRGSLRPGAPNTFIRYALSPRATGSRIGNVLPPLVRDRVSSPNKVSC